MKKVKKLKKSTNNKNRQKSTEFRPTVAEKRLLEVLLNPEHRLSNVSEVCRVAKCSRDIYYAAFKKDEFVKYFKKESCKLVDRAHAAIINASIRQAVRGDSAHTKILLSMAGSYEDRHAFIGKDGKPQDINNQNSLSEIEMATRVAYILEKGFKRQKEAEEKKKDASG